MGTRRRPLGRVLLGASLLAGLLLGLPSGPAPVGAEVRISNLSVFLNDYDVTVTVVLFGAVPDALHESIHTGIAAHVRYYVELWQYTHWGVDRRLQARSGLEPLLLMGGGAAVKLAPITDLPLEHVDSLIFDGLLASAASPR